MLDLPNTSIIDRNAERWGKTGHGPALVAIHGTPFSSQVWRRIVPHFTDRRTVYYFDLVGYGVSEMRPGQDVSLAVQNKVLVALFAEWGLERPDVLAHDFGGATALRAWYLDGLRYASLTIFDAVALAPWGSPFVQHVRQHELAFAGMPDYMHRSTAARLFANVGAPAIVGAGPGYLQRTLARGGGPAGFLPPDRADGSALYG